MFTTFDDLYTARVSYGLGGVEFQCLACGRIHNSNKDNTLCLFALRFTICKDIVNVSSLSENRKATILLCLSLGFDAPEIAALTKLTEPEPHWLMLSNRKILLQWIFENRVKGIERSLLGLEGEKDGRFF